MSTSVFGFFAFVLAAVFVPLFDCVARCGVVAGVIDWLLIDLRSSVGVVCGVVKHCGNLLLGDFRLGCIVDLDDEAVETVFDDFCIGC